MSVTAVLGAQWGDEGKGKIVDYLAASADMVIRFQGGDNAGHTVVNEFGEFKLHLVPSGIFNKSTTCLVGTGVVVNPISLLHEMNTLVEKNVSVDRLLISEKAHILMPYHIAVDKAEEANRNSKIGTTLRGIGPAYADKVARWGMQISEIYDKDNFVSKARERVERINLILKSVYNAEPVDFDAVMDEVWPACEVLRPHLTDSLSLIHAAMDRGEDILLEGQLGVMKDLDWGTSPFVTSSSPTSGGACVGAGIPPSRIEQVMGVVKAYSTSVGQGPMPTELFDEVGIMLCDNGAEFGATTGRRRRCGWFDAISVKYANDINGFTKLAVTKLDVLTGMPTLKLCVGYEIDTPQGTKVVDTVPPSCYMESARPVYEELPGWDDDITEVKTYEDLPVNAKAYLSRIQELVGVKAELISVGPRRDQTIMAN